MHDEDRYQERVVHCLQCGWQKEYYSWLIERGTISKREAMYSRRNQEVFVYDARNKRRHLGLLQKV